MGMRGAFPMAAPPLGASLPKGAHLALLGRFQAKVELLRRDLSDSA